MYCYHHGRMSLAQCFLWVGQFNFCFRLLTQNSILCHEWSVMVFDFLHFRIIHKYILKIFIRLQNLLLCKSLCRLEYYDIFNVHVTIFCVQGTGSILALPVIGAGDRIFFFWRAPAPAPEIFWIQLQRQRQGPDYVNKSCNDSSRQRWHTHPSTFSLNDVLRLNRMRSLHHTIPFRIKKKSESKLVSFMSVFQVFKSSGHLLVGIVVVSTVVVVGKCVVTSISSISVVAPT